MDAMILLPICAAIVIGTLLFCGALDSGGPIVIGLPVLLAIITWGVGANLAPKEVLRTLECKVATVDNVDLITWVDNDNNQCVDNLNKRFGRDFKEGDIVKVEIYKPGPYYGLYFNIYDKILVE